ncbi:MAG: FecR domain-containing protein [Nannocystis sp.]|uniref:FecR domain-containing protein n=1 Tax=Nannocystis sp. TaxID=1962667 RepID=UPI0024291DA5|nr:FecR domain-containing protein [Nannocystis sp.]MBK9752908.1 FecR domain-containing protein [Nannocystis sp.]
MLHHDDMPGETPPRYGCLECHEDAELAVADRLHPVAADRYRAHLRSCNDCRRMNQLLEAVYRGPDPAASGVAPLRLTSRDREFAEILRRVPAERPLPWYHRALHTAGVVTLATTAAALAVALVVRPGDPVLEDAPLGGISAALTRVNDQDTAATSDDEPASVAPHQAQVDYGRVIAGRGYLSARGDGPPVLTDTFTVGTRFSVEPTRPAEQGQSLQVGLLGRILANFEPGTEIEWTQASPSALDLTLERGHIAVRYERQAGDPVLNIHTPSALVRVVGTVFTVEVDAEGSTNVAVLRGKVEVLNPEDQAFVADVQAGYRFELARATYADVGRNDVRVAMPLSDEMPSSGEVVSGMAHSAADGTIPTSWVVPGLPAAAPLRRLENILAHPAPPEPQRAGERTLQADRKGPRRYTGLLAARSSAHADDGEALIDKLVRDTHEARREAGRAALERCKNLYQSAQTRYLSARCLTRFMAEHGDDDDLVEGHLLVGILRMDFANDYTAATLAFERFLERAPTHPEAELARYRLWLAGIEDGDIHAAIDRGREYLRRYPNGKYAGKILQRFPKLVSEL